MASGAQAALLKSPLPASDSPVMIETILSWLGWALFALVAAAVIVAGWEHLVREVGAERSTLGTAIARGTRVDVPLDTQGAASLFGPGPAEDLPTQPGPSEQAQRVATMERALSRAAEPSKSRRDSHVWMDTTPRVGDLNEPLSQQPKSPRSDRQADRSA